MSGRPELSQPERDLREPPPLQSTGGAGVALHSCTQLAITQFRSPLFSTVSTYMTSYRRAPLCIYRKIRATVHRLCVSNLV